MRFLNKATVVKGENIVFSDGFVYILSRREIDMFDTRTELDVLVLQEGAKISLKDIRKQFPNVFKVIFDGANRGMVYNYGNHSLEPGKEWELVGATVGYK